MNKDSKNINNFNDAIIRHLVDYKKQKLDIDGCGHFITYNKKTKEFIDHGEYEHILPEPLEVKLRNYMCDEAKTESSKIKRHSYWHHLNSSQTMCINFFAILLNNDYEYLNALLAYILKKNIKIRKHEFEKVLIPNSTNFDFYCEDEEGHNYYFEIKYTEKDIETKTTASKPFKTFNDIYKPLIENGTNLKFILESDNWKIFMSKHYQAYRNMVYGNSIKGDYCFFITMKNNQGTYDELQNAIKDANDSLSNVVSLYWEDLIPMTLNIVNGNNNLVNYYKEFENKYFLQ